MKTQVSVVEEQGLQVWDSRAQALQVVDDATHNEALTIATLVGQYVGASLVEAQESYDRMVLAGSVLAKVEKRLNDWHKIRTEAAHAAHKRAVADRDEELKPIVTAKIQAGTKTRGWETEQERLRRVEEARLAEIARRQQEEEALATAAEIRKQMQAEQVPEEEIAAVEEEVMQEVITRPAPAPIAAPTFQKSAATRKPTILWSARVTSIKELCAAIGRGEQPESYAMGLVQDKETGVISSPNLNKAADGQKQTKLTIPGCIGVSKESKAGFSRR